jgi:hypothetical protein
MGIIKDIKLNGLLHLNPNLNKLIILYIMYGIIKNENITFNHTELTIEGLFLIIAIKPMARKNTAESKTNNIKIYDI